MFQIPIDKHIPSPSPALYRRNIYPFERMEVGDSIFVPGIKEGIRASGLVRSKVFRGRLQGQWTSRKVTEDGVEGCRIWRNG